MKEHIFGFFPITPLPKIKHKNPKKEISFRNPSNFSKFKSRPINPSLPVSPIFHLPSIFNTQNPFSRFLSMTDYEPPSFSLGLDLGFDSQLQPAAANHSTPAAAPNSSRGSNAHTPVEVDEELEPQITGPDPDPGSRPGRPLKRLKRGVAEKREPTPATPCRNVDDDIEDFSSGEDFIQDVHPSTQYHTVSSSSKVPLRGSGVLTSQSSCHIMGRKRKPVSDVSASVSLEESHKGFMFPKLTASPLRRFQLIDSDSDDPSPSESVSRGTCDVDASSKKYSSAHAATTSETKKKSSMSTPVDVDDVDLWKDFSPIKKFSIPTPALDEIRKLVCNRLPNFFPLVNIRGNQQSGASVIDYMGQFNNGDASKQRVSQKIDLEKTSNRQRNKSNVPNVEDASGSWVNPKDGRLAQKVSVNKSSKKGRIKSVKSNVGTVEHASGNWVEPRSCVSTKRVQANAQPSSQWDAFGGSGQAAGYWYTGPGGRKVYRCKTGQELSGSAAYKQYKKESGRSVQAKKAKPKPKKKNVPKKR
ncbi:hypothetical protein C1H46_023470 [Malus baccata]|uniref:Uncharacterized protein n=1 Tax=Malus baccata TaxID=106549 RepID=A0A540LX97_MALBA|nr:hypothetical protein C1H46_023470 [Malus baccata]